jgi:hypothetical protein
MFRLGRLRHRWDTARRGFVVRLLPAVPDEARRLAIGREEAKFVDAVRIGHPARRIAHQVPNTTKRDWGMVSVLALGGLRQKFVIDVDTAGKTQI